MKVNQEKWKSFGLFKKRSSQQGSYERKSCRAACVGRNLRRKAIGAILKINYDNFVILKYLL